MVFTSIASVEKENILPDYFSWRDIDGIDYTTPIKDQSPAPTCEAYALVASLETIMQYQQGELYNPDLSEAHLYFYPGGSYESGYVNIIDAANYLLEYGVPDEGCYPDPHRAFDYPFESLPGWENRTVKIQEWGWIEKDIDTIKSSLIEYGPLIFCAHFYENFYYYTGGVYDGGLGHFVGGHVMTIVGYDDSEECWIVKNSWGTKWGDDGWLKLSYNADLFADWYGDGTGVMYIDGVYGNLKPDVPKVQIEKPVFSQTYLFGIQFKTIFKKLPLQTAAARVFGPLTIKVTAENTNEVEFYVDDVLEYTDDEAPFEWDLDTTRGLHTLETRASNGHNESIDLVDFHCFF